MLFKAIHLRGIKSGTITLAFRKWQKASVKRGSLLHTSIGLVQIHEVETIDETAITEQDALHTGFSDRKQLLQSFTKMGTGMIFKMSVSYHSEDPRIKLREQSEMSEQQLALKKKIDRLDSLSKQGHWTQKVLLTISQHPNLHAAGIARLTGFEKEWLKLNIRKLKNLGLTISHNIGYEISVSGKIFIEKFFIEKNQHVK